MKTIILTQPGSANGASVSVSSLLRRAAGIVKAHSLRLLAISAALVYAGELLSITALTLSAAAVFAISMLTLNADCHGID